MKRRADLTFRAEKPDFQMENLKVTDPDQAVENGYDKSDLFMTGTIVKIGQPVVAQSDGWDAKNSPSSFRQALVLKQDKAKNKAFRVYLFGSYATDFMLLTPLVGESMAIMGRPSLAKCRFPEKDLQKHEVRIGLHHLDSCKVCLSPAPLNSPFKKKTNPMTLQFVQDFKKAAKKLNPQIDYQALEDCKDTSKTYNTWGIVTKIQRFPKPTKNGSKNMAMVYIEDQHSGGTYGYSNYQFSILGPIEVPFPPIVLHSIMRIHHMKVEEYQGAVTFRVLDPRAVTVIEGKLDDPIIPKCTKNTENLNFSETDCQKVKELRQWWAEESKKKCIPDTNGLSQVSNHEEAGKNNNVEVSDDTLNALLAPLESQDQDSAPPITTVYPSNIDGFVLVDSQPALISQASSVDELSQPFYTCPSNDSREKLSPSPEPEFKYAITTNTNFMWMTLEELENANEIGNNFRLNGNVQVQISKKDWKNGLCLVCLDCCLAKKYDNQHISCGKCKKDCKISFHFKLTFQDYSQEDLLPKSRPQLKLYLAGHHAETLLRISADEFAKDNSKRDVIIKKLEDLNGKPVILSVCRMLEDDKNVSYQIVHSVFS